MSHKTNLGPSKHVGIYRYYHTLSSSLFTKELQEAMDSAVLIAGNATFNVIKVADNLTNITLLNYPNFDDEAFPELTESWTIDLQNKTCRHRTYALSLNPPILHRKELLLPKSHARYSEFSNLTCCAETIGLFEETNRIGFKRAWEALLENRGYQVIGHALVPIGNDDSTGQFDLHKDYSQSPVQRHLTALSRYGFSAPIQALARFGFLDGSKSLFDYGCGRGDDLRRLAENGIASCGWDPYFAPNQAKSKSHLVNLGFVINVIEDIDERIAALRGAFHLADELLVVSAMLANQDEAKGIPYGDGVITGRNTFQKYYTQNELKEFISETLSDEAIAVGPGVFFVFKDKGAEQRFMYGRLESRRNIFRLARLSKPDRPKRRSSIEERYKQHHELLESLWETHLMLGRPPDRSEIPNLDEIEEHFGSLSGALRFIKSHKENPETYLDAARSSRIDDLQVYFAKLQFEKRKPHSHLDKRLQRDIRQFFGDYKGAVEAGRDLLYSIGKIDEIYAACVEAAENGLGWLEDNASLQLHTKLVEQLPPLLRTYVQCGTHLYGDVTSADLIKIHIRSGKLTLMSFDDFEGLCCTNLVHRLLMGGFVFEQT